MSMRVHGITLIELIISVAIMGILMCFSVSLFHHTVSVQERTHDLTSILAYARLQAFLREETLILAPLVATEHHDWSMGIRLFVKEGETLPSKPRRIIHAWQWPASEYTLSWSGFQSKDYILIDHDSGKLAMNGYFLLKNSHGILNQVYVNRFGRV